MSADLPFLPNGSIMEALEKGSVIVRVASPYDRPDFLVEAPEYCFACFRPIRAGQTHRLTVEQEPPKSAACRTVSAVCVLKGGR